MSGDAGPRTPTGPVLAVDVGGTDIKYALADADGSLGAVSRTATPTDPAGPGDAVVDRIAAIVADHRRDGNAAPSAVGVIVPGLVDETAGIGRHSANIGWWDYPFVDRLTARLGLPVGFGHDVGAAGEAEFRLGAARGYRDVVVMVIGTGIAGAVFASGRPVRADGFAGEMGHARVPGGLDCACGATGCLETIGSAAAIGRRYTARTGHAVDGARDVAARAADGDADAAVIWSEALDAIAHTICQVAAILGSEAVVIGGGLSQAGDALFVPLRERVDAQLSFHRRPQILPARLGSDAGLMGAALKARDRAGTAPATGAGASNPETTGARADG